MVTSPLRLFTRLLSPFRTPKPPGKPKSRHINADPIERLEARIAPAALTAKLIAGTLTVTGDSAADNVSFSGNGDTIEVFDGATSIGTFDGVKSIKATFQGSTAASLNLAGGGISGSVRIVEQLIGQLTIAAGSTMGGSLVFKGDSAAQTIVIGSDVTIGKGLSISGGGGNDSMVVGQGVGIGGHATFSAVESITFQVATEVTIAGNLSIKNTSTTLTTLFQTTGAGGLQITGKVTFAGGAGNDTFGMGGTVGGSVSFTDSRGSNALGFQSDTMIRGAIVMKTGGGEDSFNIVSGSIDGNLTLRLGEGSNAFRYGIAGPVSIGGQVTYLTGAGDDLWQTGGSSLSVAKNVNVRLGDGANQIIANPVVSGTRVSVITGRGADQVSMDGSALNAAVDIRLGGSNDSLAGSLFRNPVSARYDGGDGTDRFFENTLTANPIIIISFEDLS